MKSLNLTGWFYICFCGFAICSCKKEHKGVGGKKDIADDTSMTQVYLPTKIVYGQLTTLYEYYPNTTRLKEIRKSTGYRYIFNYDKYYRLFEYQIYENDRFDHFAQIARDNEGVITKIVKFDVEPIYQRTYYPRGQYILQFDNNKRLSKISDYGADKKLISEKNLSYDDRGNLIHLQNALGNTDAQLAYDLKNGIYKHVSDMELVFVVHPDKELLGSTNNMLSYEDLQNAAVKRTIQYEYNSDGYPSKMTLTRKSWKEIHEITYTKLTIP